MKLLSVNVSLPKEVPYRGKAIRTEIFKEAVQGRVKLRSLNLDGGRAACRFFRPKESIWERSSLPKFHPTVPGETRTARLSL